MNMNTISAQFKGKRGLPMPRSTFRRLLCYSLDITGVARVSAGLYFNGNGLLHIERHRAPGPADPGRSGHVILRLARKPYYSITDIRRMQSKLASKARLSCSALDWLDDRRGVCCSICRNRSKMMSEELIIAIILASLGLLLILFPRRVATVYCRHMKELSTLHSLFAVHHKGLVWAVKWISLGTVFDEATAPRALRFAGFWSLAAALGHVVFR
jgi:hypothetical protein